MKPIILKVNKGDESSPLTVASQITQNIRDLFEKVESETDFEKFFGATKTVAKESFKATLIIEKL